MICLTTSVIAQNNLSREITLNRIDHQRIGAVLKKIAAKGQFTFAYNNQSVPADSLMRMNDFKGTIYSFLWQVLGNNYEYKEVPGYIILRHTPNRMLLNAVAEQAKDQQLTIRGQILNVHDMLPLGQVSIYEKNQLIATLTDNQGRFELKLNRQDGPVTLTATKEGYRDTSLNFLQEVEINSKKRRSYKYYPDETVNKLSRSFAGWFIGSKQRIQNMNLGGFFAFSPYQVSLTPGLSSHGIYSSQVVDRFSLNVLGGYTAGLQGVEMAGLFNINRRDVGFLQVSGIFNAVGGRMNGIQMAGLYNKVLDTTSGIQFAGIANSSEEVKGLQVAGLFNRAKKVKGVQLAGIFNVADSSDYPIALVNFIKNGRKSLSLAYDESQYVHIDFRSGGRVLYGLIGGAYNFNQTGKYAFDIGFGAHLLNQQFFTLDGELGYEALTNFRNDPDQISSLRLFASLKLSRRIQLFAGPTINLADYQVGDELKLHGWPVHKFTRGNSVNNIYAGITGGLQFTW